MSEKYNAALGAFEKIKNIDGPLNIGIGTGSTTDIFTENFLPKLRETYMVCSFTILSYRIIIDTARKNQLSWDAVFSCEGIKKYKILPEAYQSVARSLQLEPEQCLMVACHNFDLDAAKGVGFKTAFVRRPDEWGAEGPPDPNPNPDHDIIVDSFPDLLKKLDKNFC